MRIWLKPHRVCGKKQALKIDHLLGFACQEARGNSKGGVWQVRRAQKPWIKLRGPMTRGEAVAGVLGRLGDRSRMLRYSGKDHVGCVYEGQVHPEPEHSRGRNWESWPARGPQGSGNQRAFWISYSWKSEPQGIKNLICWVEPCETLLITESKPQLSSGLV